MTLRNNEGTVTLAVFHLLKSCLGLIGSHYLFKGLLLDVAKDPFFARAVARRHIAPRVNEEKVGQRSAGRTISALVATQSAMDLPIEECTSIVLQLFLQPASLGSEQRLHKQLMLGKGFSTFNLIVVLVEIPRIVNS